MTTPIISQITRTITLLITIFSLSFPAYAQYSGGTGEPNNPYQIATATDLRLRPVDYDKHFILTTDIDLDPNLPGPKVFVKAIIAPDTNTADYFFQGTPFTGVFDGNGHTISNLTITGKSYLGLFGQLDSGAEVRDLGIVDVNINGSGLAVGGLVGDSCGNMTQCSSTGSVTGKDGEAGGLVGWNGGDMTNCYSDCTVSGDNNVGGLVGWNPGNITNCYSTGPVSGDRYVGGLVGDNGLLTGVVYQCYSTGKVSGNDFVGGLVGNNEGWGTVLQSVWDVETSGKLGSAGGVGLSTSEMMDPYMLGLNGFANDPNWVLDDGNDYPRLAWENRDGQIIPEPNIYWLTGIGISEEPYRINTSDQLIMLSKASILCDKHFVLGADIDLNPKLPNVSVFGQALFPTFRGVFDGNGYTISNLTIEGYSKLGLFGSLLSSAEIKNLGVVDVNITGLGESLGGLVGVNIDSNITSSYSTGTVSGYRNVGGLVGRNDGIINMSYSTIMVNGERDVGGLVGINIGNITTSYSTSTIIGTGWFVAGFGYFGTSVGGLVGYNYGNITTSYSTGAVTGTKCLVGGLVGSNHEGSITNSYSLDRLQEKIRLSAASWVVTMEA